MKFFAKVVSGFIILFICTTNVSADIVRFGIIAPRGALKAQNRWGPMLEHFGETLGDTVRLVPLTPNKVESAVKNGKVDFMLANPTLTAVIKEKHGAVPLATLQRKGGARFAGNIIARRGSGIKTAKDVKGKKVMAYKFGTSAAAYIFQVKHMKDNGIEISDFASFSEARRKQDEIVKAVASGKVDVGFVKSGLMEAMAREKKISMDDFVIVDKKNDVLKHAHSTKLYPHWYISAASAIGKSKAKALAKSAISLESSSSVAKKAKIVGFVKPLPLDDVIGALKSLKLSPFDK